MSGFLSDSFIQFSLDTEDDLKAYIKLPEGSPFDTGEFLEVSTVLNRVDSVTAFSEK